MYKTSDFFKVLYGNNSKGIIFLGSQLDSEYPKNKAFPPLKSTEIDKFTGDTKINRFFTPNLFDNNKENKTRNARNLIGFTSLFLDFDCEKAGLSKEFVLEEIYKRCEMNPTVLIDSGHGIHAYWKIENISFYTKNKNTQRLIRLYKDTLDGLKEEFKDLAVDKKVTASFYMRLPNTINAKAKKGINDVTILSIDENAKYTLKEMAVRYIKKYDYSDFLNNPEKYVKKDNTQKKKFVKKTRKYTKKGSYKKLDNDRIDDLITLINLREGKVESRNIYLRLAIYLNYKRVYEVNNCFSNRENDAQIESLKKFHKSQLNLENIEKMSKWTNSKIIEHLKITKEEQKQLKTIISKEESNYRNKIRMRKVRKLPSLAKNIIKTLQKLYIQKFADKLSNEELASDLHISIASVKRYKKENIDVSAVEKNLKIMLDLIEKKNKTIDNLKLKNVNDYNKKEYVSCFNYLTKVA